MWIFFSPGEADKQGTAAGEYNALQCVLVKKYEQMGVDVEG